MWDRYSAGIQSSPEREFSEKKKLVEGESNYFVFIRLLTEFNEFYF